MKELSIEEKAKAYDEAYKVAEKIHKFSSDLAEIKRMEQIFPELKESEDGKIRKELITHCRNTRCVTEEGAERIAKWISWLEKQGQTFTKKDVDDAYLKGVCDAKQELEKQDEQKHDDKVEPKFKNGQWIVWQDKCYKVNYNGCGYELVDQNGLSTSLEYGTIDKGAHLWTIQEAKAGDILSYENEIFIVKKSVNINILYYCCYDREHFIIDSFYSLTIDDIGNITPATKEQRNLLFQKMKEAGYEWDAEKKELKKIVVPIFNIGDTIAKKHNSNIHDFDFFTITDITGGKYWYNDRIICDITEQDEWELVKQKRN